MDLQRPKAAAEGYLLRGRDALVAKDQHHMLPVRAQDAVEVRIAQRLGQVQPEHFGAQRGRQAADFKLLRCL